MSTISYSCAYCNKKYIRKFAFNNHIEKCKFYRFNYTNTSNTNNTNNINIVSSECVNKNENMCISNNTLFKMLMDLTNKYEKLQADYDELKKHTNITKNKISIIEYLNSNYNSSIYDFNNFTNSIIMGREELNIIFKKDYIEGITTIILNNLEKIESSNSPLKAFNQKEGILYIYSSTNIK